jgi:hypothetical protein
MEEVTIHCKMCEMSINRFIKQGESNLSSGCKIIVKKDSFCVVSEDNVSPSYTLMLGHYETGFPVNYAGGCVYHKIDVYPEFGIKTKEIFRLIF